MPVRLMSTICGEALAILRGAGWRLAGSSEKNPESGSLVECLQFKLSGIARRFIGRVRTRFRAWIECTTEA